MNNPQPPSPRARLQELLAIPERERTDEQWDELNELEIMLASGNREAAPGQNQNIRRNDNQPQGHSKPGGGGGMPHGRKPQRKFHNRPPKRKGP